MNCIEKMKFNVRRFSVPVVSGASVFLASGSAFAEGNTSLIDFSSLASAVQTDVTAALTAILPFLGLLCGAVIGWRIFRKFTGARP